MAHVHLQVFLLVAVIAVSIQGVNYCPRPFNPQLCPLIKLSCIYIDRRACIEAGGTYLPRGGICGVCPVCVKYVGLHCSCNTGQFPEPKCSRGLHCSTENRCVRHCVFCD